MLVNVGTWKAYEPLHWLELWAPHFLVARKITRAVWQAALPPGCGFCGQCQAPPTRAYRQWDVLAAAGGGAPALPRIFAYEASPALREPLEQLVSRLQLSQVLTVTATAVGATAQGTVRFPRCPQDREDCYIESRHVSTDYANVPITTLDAEAARHGWEHVYLLTIDTEGYDPAVLEGASKLLSEGRITYAYGGGGGKTCVCVCVYDCAAVQVHLL